MTKIISKYVGPTKNADGSKFTAIQDDNKGILEIVLPMAFEAYTIAIVTLCVGAPYASGGECSGIEFAIHHNIVGTVTNIMSGAATYTAKYPSSYGRLPITLVGTVALPTSYERRESVYAVWQPLRGATAIIDHEIGATLTIQTGIGG